ncbi:beta strand repeat-containing protein [Urbifossiella limnaea]|uniref:Uncharacterized protein n=1 Tax=Urbifossiella limnaea TaxID=2528023 RepID=A0A517Y1A2_9BACT|nr:S-layer family protein [Urbifossiella limnaea]QDU23547.1 hypothetical protein ETAA1_55480 [Urbifossiella limnaea]
MTRSVRPQPTGTIRKTVSPLRTRVEGLEDRVKPATLNYDAATDLLTFTADAGDTDNVAVTAPGANQVVIVVANGDTLTLTGDATLANGFVLNGAADTVTIDTGTSAVANFKLNLGDANDTIAFSLAAAANNVANVSIDGEANADTATIGTTTVTGNLAVAVESINSTGTATVGAGAGNSITLTADTITDGNAAGVNFVAATGTLTITKSNANATNVDLDTTVGSLNATAATGNIVIDETDGLTVTAANANGAGGAVTVTSATGNITVVTVNASTTATLTATAGSILDDDTATVIAAASAVLAAGNGTIGTLLNFMETTVDNLTTTSLAANGSQFITETNGLTELNLNAGSGNVALNSPGGAILSADSAVDVTAASASLVANVGSIGSTSTAAGNAVETSVATLTAVAFNGSVFVRETDAITLSAVNASGAGNDVSVLNVTGDITVATVLADDDVSLTATAGSILDDGAATIITGDVVPLAAGANIGQPGATAQIDTAAASITASVTTAAFVATPGIWIGDSDAVTITTANTADGSVVLDAGGTMTIDTVTAGGTGRNVRLRTLGAGDIAFGAAGSVSAAGDAVRLEAAGAITASGTAVKVTAASLAATAGNGIATVGDPLTTAVTNLAASSGTNGIFVANTGALTIATVGPLFGGTVIGVSAVGAGGAAAVTASSPLTVAANVATTGTITLTATDSAAAGDDLTINSGVIVTSTGANVILNAGDNVSIPAGATVNAANTLTINADQPADPDVGTGSTVTIAGDLNAASATINGGADADTFNVTADSVAPITPIAVFGGAPSAPPGDTLNYTGPSPATKSVIGPGIGVISAAGVGNVAFADVETVAATGTIVFSNVINLSLIAGGQDGNPNQVVLQLDATGAFFQVLVDTNTNDNGGVSNPLLFAQQPTAGTLAATVIGGTDADTLVLRANASGALPQLTNVAAGSHSNAAFTHANAAAFVNSAGNENVGLHFDGGASADTLRIELGASESVAYFSDTVDTANSGVVSIAGDLNLSFENLAPLVVVGAGGAYLVDASANASLTTMNITNSGGAADGVSTVDGNGTFEDTDFSGFATVTVRSGPGVDTIP